jgi:hypothetical protein
MTPSSTSLDGPGQARQAGLPTRGRQGTGQAGVAASAWTSDAIHVLAETCVTTPRVGRLLGHHR